MIDLNNPDLSVASIRKIYSDFSEFYQNHVGNISEADTRVKIVDRFLVEVLYWPESNLIREHRVINSNGFTDYELNVFDKTYVIVEAKREGIAFELPQSYGRRKLKVSTLLASNPDVRDAIMQVRSYCDDLAIKFAIATNGYTWIIFKALSEGTPWKEGFAVIFYDIDDILKNFADFWNLLAYDHVVNGRIENEFSSLPVVSRNQYRVINKIYNANLPLERNKYNAQLSSFISLFFKDIADQDYLDILKTCYVPSRALNNLEYAISDSIPKFLFNDGAVNVRTNDNGAGFFQTKFEKSITNKQGEMFLILGGIGCGKTTFLKMYYKVFGNEFITKNAIWFHINLLGAPEKQENLEKDIWDRILLQYRERYSDIVKENRHNIKQIFEKELDLLYESRFKAEGIKQHALEQAISPYIESWQSDSCKYAPGLLRLCQRRNRVPIICIDNVDQLPSTYQAQVFLTAQNITRQIGCITILSLREETYYSTRIQKTFTAYTNQKFHIASPRFLALIYRRLNSACKILDLPDEELYKILNCAISIDKDAIRDLFTIIMSSVLTKSQNIAKFIESLCFGNMRAALDMFATFTTSGVTDVDKMIKIFRRDTYYCISVHEFVKSIMLGDRRYYKEDQSKIMNLFNCGTEKNSSHFTAFRALKYLEKRVNESSREGEGYVDVSQVLYLFDTVFDNREDLLKTLSRLLSWNLIEVDTHSIESIIGASFVRITSSGLYYINELVHSFCYLDLVLQDTPLDDAQITERLVEYLKQVDNLADRVDNNKLQRICTRFDRVDLFLSYLEKQEQREQETFSGLKNNLEFSYRITDIIFSEYNREKEWILKRLEQNAEKRAQVVATADIDLGELDWESLESEKG
jgi:hypothetical protein